MSFAYAAASLGFEIAGLIGVIWALAHVLRIRRLDDVRLRTVAVAVIVTMRGALAVSGFASALGSFKGDRLAGTSGAHARTFCADEYQHSASLVSFLVWVKRQLPRGARYWLAPSPLLNDLPRLPSLDPLCVQFILLPDLPLDTRAKAIWTVTTGAVPADLRRRIERHDPTVRVFAPGFVLARNETRS